MDVSGTPVHLVTGGGLVKNVSGDDLFVGAQNVTTETGFPVPANTSVAVGVAPVFGVSSGTSVVSVLAQGLGTFVGAVQA